MKKKSQEAATREPAIRVIMMPKDTNALGTIFGGIILSHIDLAGAVALPCEQPHRARWRQWQGPFLLRP